MFSTARALTRSFLASSRINRTDSLLQVTSVPLWSVRALNSSFMTTSSSGVMVHSSKEREDGGVGEQKDDEQTRHPDAEKEPLPEHPGGINPETGEERGPRGPEPTRYGDWERKGRVSDF